LSSDLEESIVWSVCVESDFGLNKS